MFSQTDLAQCRKHGCGKSIRWTTTELGKMLAVDAYPDPDGNTAVWKDVFGVLCSRRVTKARPLAPHEKLMRPHTSTCLRGQRRTATDGPPRQPPPRPAPAEGELYGRLGVDQRATALDIKKAYRRLARQLHPDLHPGDAAAAERFKKVTEAYDVLSDPRRRATYDVTGRRPTPR
ncbi:DnaJ domain-containing protein [Nonomuraea sp. NPDC052129]|uniref:J domain-containing protein n=1 Tax=Nonomuraea sp. NPDC052129 TaxID=3154651 RepID=UPI003427D32D